MSKKKNIVIIWAGIIMTVLGFILTVISILLSLDIFSSNITIIGLIICVVLSMSLAVSCPYYRKELKKFSKTEKKIFPNEILISCVFIFFIIIFFYFRYF